MTFSVDTILTSTTCTPSALALVLSTPCPVVIRLPCMYTMRPLLVLFLLEARTHEPTDSLLIHCRREHHCTVVLP